MPSSTGVRRVPSQARSRELVAVIVEAGVRVLREEGPEALTTRRIAERAGVSIGSLYQYFADKDAVIDAVWTRYNERFFHAAAAFVPTLAALPLQHALTVMVETAIEHHRCMYRLHPRAYLERAALHSLTTLNPNAREPITQFVTMILECHRESLAIRSPERAAFLLTRTLGGLLVRTLDERPEYVDSPHFLDEVVRMMRGLLMKPELPALA